MAKKDFNLGNRFANVQKSPQQQVRDLYDFQVIHHTKLRPSHDNFYYGEEELHGLKLSMLRTGINAPVGVRPADDNGMHLIIGGERRYRACVELYEEGHELFQYVACFVRPPAKDACLSENDSDLLDLILDNATNRDMTQGKRRKEIEKLEMLMGKMRESGAVEGERTRELIAQVLMESKSKIGMYQHVTKGLDPVLLSAFDKGEIGITHADAIASLPSEKQEPIARLYTAEGKEPVKDYVRKEIIAGKKKAVEPIEVHESTLPTQLREVASTMENGEEYEVGEVCRLCRLAADTLDAVPSVRCQ